MIVLDFPCAAIIPSRNAVSNIICISKSYSPRGVALVKRNNKRLAQNDDEIVRGLGGCLDRVVPPLLGNLNTGLDGQFAQGNRGF